MNARVEQIKKKIDDLESELFTTIDALLIEEGMKIFVQWAKAFPKRDIRFVSGMGTATFACPSIDSSCFLTDIDDYCEGIITCGYSARVENMIQPLIDFSKLFWSFDIYKYPSIPDIIYNPVTRTVECGHEIIQLDNL